MSLLSKPLDFFCWRTNLQTHPISIEFMAVRLVPFGHGRSITVNFNSWTFVLSTPSTLT